MAAMLAATMINATGGFLFWILAAHLTSTTEVGTAATLISFTSFVCYATNLGLGITVARFVTSGSLRDRMLLSLAFVTTVVSSSIAALVLAALWDERRYGSGSTTAAIAVFVTLTALVSAAPLVDIRLMALRQGDLMLKRAIFVVAAKCALLFVFQTSHQALWLFVVATLPDAASTVVAALLLTRGTAARWIRGPRPAGLRPLTSFAGAAYLGQLAINAPMILIPVIVLADVTSEEFASFFVAWSATLVVLFVPQALMWALHLEGNRDGARIGDQVSLSLRVSAAATVGCLLIAIVAGPVIPLVFGPGYQRAATLLPWLVAGVTPLGIVLVYLSSARVEHRNGLSLCIAGSDAVFCVVPCAIATPILGLAGAALSWLAGCLVAAAVAAILHARRDHWRQSPAHLADLDELTIL